MNNININSNKTNTSFKGVNKRVSKFITSMTKGDAMAPVMALEACVVTGRTYQAYKRGKWDEARERFIEEIMGSITWLGGVLSLNWLGDKFIAKIMKSNGKNFDVGTDKILRTPFDNFMNKIAPKKFSPNTVAGIKFAKVMTSIILANLFIGAVVPKVNQALTRKLRHERKLQTEQQNTPLSNVEQSQKTVTFKGGMLRAVNGFTNMIENTNAGKLLSGDAGIVTGRMYNARSKEERREIAIRDIGSIYFYMWASGHIGNVLNYLESGKAVRLNPNTAAILDKHIQNYFDNKHITEMSVKDFRLAMLGKSKEEIQIHKGLKFETEKLSALDKLFNNKPLEVIKLSEIEKSDIDKSIIEQAKKMADLQPERMNKLTKQREKVLTKQQLIDCYNVAEINNPDLLHNVFSEYTGGKGKEVGKNANGKPILSEFEFVGGNYNDEYRYVSNKKLYKLKAQMEQYVETVCKAAKGGNVNKKLLNTIKNKNIIYSGINFAAGFIFAAAFLSTFIPKIQYYVTRKTTGVDAFPGVYDFEHHKEVDA